MSVPTIEELTRKKCLPCEGGIPALTAEEVDALLLNAPGWSKVEGGLRIRREWRAKHFGAAMEFFNRVATLAEAEGHHPDLHLTNYREVAIEIWTHAIGGLSENDFILAAKIDLVPIVVKKG